MTVAPAAVGDSCDVLDVPTSARAANATKCELEVDPRADDASAIETVSPLLASSAATSSSVVAPSSSLMSTATTTAAETLAPLTLLECVEEQRQR